MSVKPRIWVDGQCFQTASNVRGIGRYAADLLSAIYASERAELIVSLNGNMKEEAIAARNYLRSFMPNIEIPIWYGVATGSEYGEGFTPSRQTDAFILKAHINKIAPDIALNPSPFEGAHDLSSPFLETSGINALTACVFHDAIPYRFPSAYLSNDADRKVYMRRLNSIRGFDFVLCNSDFTKSEYRDIFKSGNCATIGAGLSGSFARYLESDTVEATPWSNIGRYVLYVGGMDWRKNVPMLVSAMAKVPEAVSGNLKLVLAGANSQHLITQLRQFWEGHGLAPANLIATNWISDRSLASLYRGATVAVQPSLMEGFGLTALEAMASGCAFLSARGGAVAEVVGDEGVLFDPQDPRDLAQKLSRVLNDKAFRETTIARGLTRSEQFSWHRAASLALDALEGALETSASKREAPRVERGLREEKPRLLMDVTSTAESPVMSGIQRVMHNLSRAMQGLDSDGSGLASTQLSYCRDRLGWYSLPDLDKTSVSLDPCNRLGFGPDDSYLLLDSSWTFIEGQRDRLLDAVLMGQEVVSGIHDIGPLTMPAFTDSGMPPAFRRWLEFALGYSTGIICVSRAVADEVYHLLEAIQLPRPMKVGYFNLGGDFARAAPDTRWLDFTVGRPTFLMVGTIEPRKAHWVAIEAFERLWARGLDANLLIIGKAGWDTRLLRSRLHHHPETEKRLFVRTGITDAELCGAYTSAQALIMTSYMEGFGLPVAEAGALGCPVILADIPVFREVSHAAPQAKFFRSCDPEDLADRLQEVIDRGFDGMSEVTTKWPGWRESARQVQNVIFGGKWYKQYQPREVLPDTKLSNIGQVFMTKPLSESGRKHSMRCLEGPLLSDNGRELRFVIALRNEGDEIWSSTPKTTGGFDVNLGSHIYAENGTCLDFENPRTKLPFIVAPGQEAYLPVRLSSDWLARGGHAIGVEVVQEGVSWLGERIRLDLLQTRASSSLPESESTIGADLLYPVLFCDPFTVGGNDEQILLFSVYNQSAAPVYLDRSKGESGVSVSVIGEGGETSGNGHCLSCFSRLAPGSYGLMCLSLPVHLAHNATAVAFTFNAADTAEWHIELSTKNCVRALDKSSKEKMEEEDSAPSSTEDEEKAASEIIDVPKNAQKIDLDDYKSFSNEEFCKSIYITLMNKYADEGGLAFYKWALDTQRLTRLGAVYRILHDNGLRQHWHVISSEPEFNVLEIKFSSDMNAQEVIKKIESSLKCNVPSHLQDLWAKGQLSVDEMQAELQKTLDPFFYRVALVDTASSRQASAAEGIGRRKSKGT